ncbi:DUF7706 family protein [Povalibacter sp.]|uniref:DUF7706 family protein n=1 Tax=Povalibacter sp. TaxID=1962978 RepID=UPI003BEF1320
MQSVEITVTFTAAQAWQFAQFLKRVSFREYRNNATCDDEAYLLRNASEIIREVLTERSYALRRPCKRVGCAGPLASRAAKGRSMSRSICAVNIQTVFHSGLRHRGRELDDPGGAERTRVEGDAGANVGVGRGLQRTPVSRRRSV